MAEKNSITVNDLIEKLEVLRREGHGTAEIYIVTGSQSMAVGSNVRISRSAGALSGDASQRGTENFVVLPRKLGRGDRY